IGILQDYVPNEGDAWRHALDALSQYFDRAVTRQTELQSHVLPRKPLIDLLCDENPPSPPAELIGPYYENVKTLGRRTAELHSALASDSESPDFAPEPFSVLYQRSLYQSMRNHAGHVFVLLRKRLNSLAGAVREDAEILVDRQGEIMNRFKSIL